MTNHKQGKVKRVKRCIISNKDISNKEVVIVDYAIDYVKKQGYQVIPMKKEYNMNTFLIYFITAIALLSMIPFVHSAPPFTQSSTTLGLNIAGVVNETYIANQTILFPYHVFNASNGIQMTNATTSCSLHIVNQTGEHVFIWNNNVSYKPIEYEFEIEVPATLFKTIGEYTNLFTCNTSTFGGTSQQTYIIVNPTQATSTSIWNFPSNTFSWIAIGILFILALVFLFTGHSIWTGFITMVIGLLLIFNGTNKIVSLLIIAGGFILTMSSDK